MTRSSNSFANQSLTESSNTFSDNSFSSGSGTFADLSITGSSNSFTDESFTGGSSSFGRTRNNASLNGWDGDNLSSDYFAQYGDYEGAYFGQGSFGGIRHFNK